MIRSYRYLLQMNARLGRSFEAAMAVSNQIYNAALEERISAWQKAGKSITKFDQIKSLTQVRAQDPMMPSFAVTMLRTPLTQVDEAFKGFFSRLKKGGAKAGFPRFRALKRLRSSSFTEANGWRLKGQVLRMKGLPAVRLNMHRPIAGNPLKLTIKRDGRGRWFAIIVAKMPVVFGPVTQGVVGLDVGVENLATDSNGMSYEKVSPYRAAQRKNVEHALARQKRGSRRWRQTQKRLSRQRSREADARRTRHFQLDLKLSLLRNFNFEI